MADPTEQTDTQVSPEGEAPPPIQWRSWPARDGAVRTIGLVLALLGAAAVVQWVAGQIALTALAFAALGLALWRFFLPVEFELSDEGVGQRFLGRRRHIPWQAIDGYEVCSAGVLLLPYRDRSPMASFRGLYVPWTSHREEVLTHVRYRLDRSETEVVLQR